MLFYIEIYNHNAHFKNELQERQASESEAMMRADHNYCLIEVHHEFFLGARVHAQAENIIQFKYIYKCA